LDNGATTLVPRHVVDAMGWYYNNCKSSVHRGVHTLSKRASFLYEESREIVAEFIGADVGEIIFTGGTTESLNLLAHSLTRDLEEGDEVVITQMEHHSNLVPWQQLAKERSLVLKYIEVKEDGTLDMGQANEIINDRTKIVSVVHVSNVLGTINDVRTLGEVAHRVGAVIVVDGAQSVPSMNIDVKDLGCDFFVFSGHKMVGPTGIGVLYGKRELLEKTSPFLYGGGMIEEVGFKETSWLEPPLKFEAGTPKIAEAIGLAQAVKYLKNIGMRKIEEHGEFLGEYALRKLGEIEDLVIYGPRKIEEKKPVISFTIKGIHPHDISEILDKYGVAVRGGHLCAQPLVNEVLKVDAITRASFYFYNTFEDVDILVEGIKKVKEVFSR